jgi:uncharacterized membrane protein YjjP (DUF1212 family)
LPTPTATLGFILATLIGAAFHFIFGGDVKRLALFFLSAWLGFALGHYIGELSDFNLFNIGTLHVASAGIGALMALFMAHIFTAKSQEKPKSR